MALDQNATGIVPVLGQADFKVGSPGSISCIVDANSATLLAGQEVKLVDDGSHIPNVTAVTSDADTVYGFVPLSFKDASFPAGSKVEILSLGSCVWLVSTAAIARGARVKGVVATLGGVATAVQGSGSPIVGWAFDKATASGQLIRVMLVCPSYFTA